MKKYFLLFISLFISIVIFAQTKNIKKVQLKTLQDSASYALGLSIANNLSQANLDSLNLDALILGFKHAKNPELNKIVISDINDLIMRYSEQVYREKYANKILEGEKFLAENKKKKGVITTSSGLQYEILQHGNGDKPMLGDSITVYYHGTKIDNSVFDSNIGKESVTFPLIEGRLIQGWIEAMQLMQEGAKFKVYLSYDLAFGIQGNSTIQPFETLIFEIELLKVIHQSDFKYPIEEIPTDEYEFIEDEE